MRYWLTVAAIFIMTHPLIAEEIDEPPSETECFDEYPMEKGSDFGNADTDVERPFSLTNLESAPSVIINGSVNAITGDYTITETDLILPCAEPLQLQRSYQSSDPNSGSMCKSWNYNNFGLLSEGTRLGKHDKKIHTAKILGAYGAQIVYDELEKNMYKVGETCLEKGLTNISQGIISGQTNSKNEQLIYNKTGKNWDLSTGAGARLTFERVKNSRDYLLSKERRPNANFITYGYDKYNRLEKVETKNRNGKILAGYSYNYRERPDSKYGFICDLTSHDQRTVTYIFDRIKKGSSQGYYLIEAQRPSDPIEYFTYSDKHSVGHPRLIRKNRADNRFQDIEYYTKGEHQLPHYVVDLKESNNPFIGRVKLLKAPVGTDATPITTHQFCYYGNQRKRSETGTIEVLDGYTQVYDAYNRMTSYSFNTGHRLTKVQRYVAAGHLYSAENLYWDDPYRPHATNLISRTYTSCEAGIHFCKSVDYDLHYNVLREYLWGNLSGWNPAPIQLQENGVPYATGCEVAIKSYTYSGEGRNLVLSEKEDNTTIHYSYHPDTNLLASKITLVHDKVILREFYDYDADAMAVREIIDDGCSLDKNNLAGVTERHIKRTVPTSSNPNGLPAIIEEKVLDLAGGAEILLKKTVNHYSKHARLIRKDVFDSNGQFAYACEWDYDGHGNVMRETNAFGQSILRHFDVHNNVTSESGPRPGFRQDYVYDFSDRLIRKDLVTNSGVRLTEHYRYNYVNQKVGQTDVCGNETRYVYDDFGRHVKTIHPYVFDENGQVIEPVTKAAYDPMSFPAVTIDARGFTTHKHHNIKGKPFHIIYPDGTEEKHVYNFNGTVRKTIHVNGTYTQFTYDGLKRLTSKETYSPSGELLTSTSATYSSFRLLSETDTAGHVTYYKYDFAGRLIETKKGDSRVTQTYDTLGRIAKTCSYFGPEENDYTAAIQVYDVADRVIEEREEDSAGKILKKIGYAYDEVGNKTRVTVQTEDGIATTLMEYDYCNRPIKTVDALGNTTITTYDCKRFNSIGQAVLYEETTDSLGTITACMKDALGRVVHIEKKNTLGQTVQQGELFYDANGNKRRQVDTVFTPGAPERQVTTLWEYDVCNRLVSLTEAYSTAEQKCVHTLYNAHGQKETIVKADGTLLRHTYDLLGRVKEYFSNDDTIHYRYEYDASCNVVRAEDLIHNTSTYRTFDENNRMMTEQLANGLSCSYTYDAQGRPLTVTLPDGSGISYGYKASQLKSVDRLTKEGNVVYTHEYAEYNLTGQHAKIALAGGLGTIDLAYNLLGQITSSQSPYLTETFDSYDSVGNLRAKTLKDPFGTIRNTYAYDDLYQLASETGVATHEYRCDSLYNRVTKDGRSHEVNALNQLIHNGLYTFEYDQNGNLIKKIGKDGTVSYAYDALDRLTTVHLSNGTQLRYRYDEQNRRLSRDHYTQSAEPDRKLACAQERFLYLGQNEVGSVNAKDVIGELRILGTGKGAEIGAAVALEIQGGCYVPLHDQSGNVAVIVDMATKQVVESYRYSAFGEETIYDQAGDKTLNSLNPWRFSCKRVDPETGFIYFGRRYYDTDNGRWVTADPLGFEGGPNLYAYVMNSPLTHFDLYGLYGVGNTSHSDGAGSEESSAMERSFSDRSMKFFQNIAKGPGRIIEYIGFNLVPIPIVRDVVEIVGRFASGKGLNGYNFSWKDNSYFFTLGRPDKDPQNMLSAINGMNTSEKEFIKRVWDMSDKANGDNFIGIYNHSRGLVYGFIDCCLQTCGVMTRSAQVALDAHHYMLNQMGSEGTIHQHAFSQGNLIMDCVSNHLSRSECKQIKMHAYGSPAYFEEKTFKKLIYANSCLDPIPFFGNPRKYMYHCIKRTGVISHSNGTPILDHNWNSSFYQTEFQKNITKYNEGV